MSGMHPPPGDGGHDARPFDPAAVVHGTESADAMAGTAAADDLSGGDGADTIAGAAGDDRLWGNLGDDVLGGGDGDDTLTGSFGADVLDGGAGDDHLLSRSDAGEPEIADTRDHGGDVRKVRISDSLGFEFDPKDLPNDDTLTGGAGADCFCFEFTIGAKARQLEVGRNTRPDGDVEWMKIAMSKNGSAHYHWVDSVGDDVITDFNRAEGDRITLTGHTVDVARIEIRGESSVVHLISRNRNPDAKRLAHEGDDLGSITVLGEHVTMDDIEIDPTPVFGSFVTRRDPGVDTRRTPFLLDDTGVLPGQGFHGEDPWMM